MSGTANRYTATFDDVLTKIRSEHKDNKRELGARFEKITKDFFLTDKHYSNRFSKVWMWKEWPGNDGADTGIDLVAEERDGGRLCAIQCKCYADDGTLDMKSVSTFMAKASSLKIPNTILVYTGDSVTDNLDKVLRGSGTAMLRHEHFRDSSVDWSRFPKLIQKAPNKLREHQTKALADVLKGFGNNDRGKMIMACGTGKTMTALHIAEQQVGQGGMILYVVPSISLILQSMREWSQNRNIDHRYAAVCSDKSTGDDSSITELEIRASTDVASLKDHLKGDWPDTMTVVFSTYHSLDVVKKAMGKKEFDLILCDEAHRTTGVEDKSFFTTIHSDKNIRGKKRLYMTATPRVYSDAIQAKLGKVVYSMDDESKFGPEFHNLSFTTAVGKKILTDFKVKIAIVPEDVVDKDFQQAVSTKDSEMPLDERTLFAAVWDALQYPDDDRRPRLLQRVIAFANRIDRSMMFAGMITDGNDVNRSFKNVVDAYAKKKKSKLGVDVRHLDGKSKALYRRNQMKWLDSSTNDPNTCRILSNAKCLSEGVDVPALDGVIFLNPRKSRVDVVQSVGRVMRRSPGKDFGYVILPVALPAGKEYHESLNDNKTFKVVWQVLNALRSHDENFGAEINKLILDRNAENTSPTPRISISVLGQEDISEPEIITKFFDRVKSELVRKVGDINYYDKYGMELGAASLRIQHRIHNKIKIDKNTRKAIKEFRSSLQKIINDQVTEEATIQVMAQHIVLSRVFDLLFQGEFSSNNPISMEFEKTASEIGMTEELEKLEGFYEDVEKEVSGIKTREARQAFIKKIYGNFLQSADKKGAEKYGIVYTPLEIIDFILNSVQHVLKTEFGTIFDDRSVKVLEPFAGTGTFLTRLLESGLISQDALYEKYRHDLHANEIVLLAYYIATVNVETTYQSLRRGNRYVPFEGINYTDTLTLNPRYREAKRYREQQERIEGAFQKAQERLRIQRFEHLHVIIGNPPYSMGQSNYNDQNQNMQYPEIDERIEETYRKKTKAVNPKIGHVGSLYDSYIRSLRWASDRIGKSGVIGFVTNGSFIRSEVAAGIRAAFRDEFTDVWVFDLRGNQRTQGETSKKEGGKVFGSGSRAPVAITILVKNPKKKGCTIRYKDIGDYHSQEKKLDIIGKAGSIAGISGWQKIKPDTHHDWLDQRHDEFSKYLPMGSKDAKAGKINAIFKSHSNGVKTNRDAWVYNSAEKELSGNMKTHIDYCKKHVRKAPELIDPKSGKWDGEMSEKLRKFGAPEFDRRRVRTAQYRPFFKQYMYFDKTFNLRQYLVPQFFPKNDSENLVICVPYKFNGVFSTFITDITPDLHIIAANQCFPLYTYKNGKRQENITDQTLKEYQEHYNNPKITKRQIFEYVYGLLHNFEYRKKFANNLTRELPHIPMAPDFWAFRDVGKSLMNLHLHYETGTKYNLGKPKFSPKKFTKLQFGSKKITKDGKLKPVPDKSVIYGDDKNVIFKDLPDVQYRVNGRTPMEWLVDRYNLKVDKDSSIVNDPLAEMTGQEIIDLIRRLVHIGVESDRLMASLPKEFEPKDWEPKKTGMDKWVGGSAQTRL